MSLINIHVVPFGNLVAFYFPVLGICAKHEKN